MMEQMTADDVVYTYNFLKMIKIEDILNLQVG